MQSAVPSNLSPEFCRAAEKIGIMRGKVKTLTGVLAMKWLNNHRTMSERNQEAENRHIRRTVWGETDQQQAAAAGGEGMGHIVLGDVIHPAPIVVQSPPSPSGGGLVKTLAALAIGAAFPAAGIGGFLLNKFMTPAAPVAPITAPVEPGETIGVGLSHWPTEP